MGIFTQSDKKKFKKIKEADCEVSFSIELPEALVKEETDNQLMRIQASARLPGFRQGKAPMEVVRRQYEGHARETVFDRLLRSSLPEALKELGINPVAAPVVREASHEPGKPLQFKVSAEVAPNFVPKDYLKIKVARKSYRPSDADLEARLKEIREGNARLETSGDEAVGENHYVLIDSVASRGGKKIPGGKSESELVDMSSDQTIEGLTNGLLGLKRGESRDLPVKINKEDAQLAVTVKEIKTKKLPELDVEFAKDMGFESVEQFKSKLREVMEKEGQARSDREVILQIEEGLIKANRIPVPQSLVESQLQSNLERLRKQHLGPKGQFSDHQIEDLKGKLKPRAEEEIRISYILSAIARREKLEALDADIDEEMNKNLETASSDEQKNELRRLFKERRDSIAGIIRDRKTMKLLREKAVVTEA